MLSDIIPEIEKDAPLMDLPHSSRFQIPFIRVEALLKEHGFKAVDKSGGLVTLIRHCVSDDLLKPLENMLYKEFKNRYKTIEIKNLNLVPQSPLASDFKDFTFEKWRISSSTLRRSKGSFSATYLDAKGMRKTFYFRFEIDATLKGFKAKHNLSNGTILTLEALEPAYFNLDEISDVPLETFESNEWILKHYIRQDTVILLRHLEQKPLVTRHSYVDALVRDGGLVITMRAQALSDGSKGDIVRVRTSEGRMFNAIVMSSSMVLIKE
jgi:flagella basal body P-ring formation protein FlgA